ncbi:MAG TPA: hypothetical protein PK134_05300 [Bacteroidia bacterium]|nr:hypothetical protein [Bacteroidia bacterium]
MFKKIPDTFHIGALSALALSVLAWLLISRTESYIVTSAFYSVCLAACFFKNNDD